MLLQRWLNYLLGGQQINLLPELRSYGQSAAADVTPLYKKAMSGFYQLLWGLL